MNFFQQVALFITSFILAILPSTKYVEGVTGQPNSFLPSKAVTQSDKTISSLIYRGLFKYDIYGALLPDLAETWSISEDGLVYTIKIKAEQKWSDGKKVTSDDLIYSAFKVADLSGVATDKVDDLTVRYVLPNKFSPFLSLLTVGVMQNNTEENQDALVPVSNGKFRVLRIERSGPAIRQVTLINSDKNENIQRLVFRYYANEPELVTAAKLGEIDGFLSNSTHDLENFNDYKFPLQGVYYALYFNLKNENLKDVEFRRSLEKVLPLEKLISEEGIYVQGPISRSVFTDDALNFNNYDPKFSSDLSVKTLSITVPDIAKHLELAKQIQAIWEDKLGLKVNIKKVDPAKFNEQVVQTRDFEVLFYGQEVGRDPDRYVNWHSTQSAPPGLNLSGFDHVRADRALEEGRKEVDNDKRVVHYDEFQKVIADQVPAIFLYHPYSRYYVSKYIQGIGDKYTFTLSDRFLDFSNWKKVVAL